MPASIAFCNSGASHTSASSSQISKPCVPKPGVLAYGASEIATRSSTLIGDWPCLALMMISVDVARSLRLQLLFEPADRASTKSNSSVSALPGVALASR